MAKTKLKSAPTGQQCIFCKSYGMSNQHIWPQWIKRSEIYPDSNLVTTRTQVLTGRYDAYNINTRAIAPWHKQDDVINRSGNAFARKMRMVCRTCNNGWMSKIEDASKDIVLDLQAHNPSQVSIASQNKLVAWIALMTIIGEFTDIPTKAIPYQDREYFYANKLPPLHWHIWVGKYKGERWKLRYRHHGYSALPDDPFTRPDPNNIKANWQSSTFVVGGLLMHVISTTKAVLDTEGITFSTLAKVWPQNNGVLHWPALPIQDDDATDVGSDIALNRARAIVYDIMREVSDMRQKQKESPNQ